MLKRLAPAPALALILALFANPLQAQDDPAAEVKKFATDRVVIKTTMGDITVVLETERAPVTAGNFLRYVDDDRFDGTTFYRAMRLDWDQPNGLIQAGTQNDPERILDPIAHEPTNETGVLHTKGALSMARFAPGTATGDFSIVLRDQPYMDADPEDADPERRAGFAAFGHVVGGWDVVLAIHALPTDPEKGDGFMQGQMLADPVKIIDIHRIGADAIGASLEN